MRLNGSVHYFTLGCAIVRKRDIRGEYSWEFYIHQQGVHGMFLLNDGWWHNDYMSLGRSCVVRFVMCVCEDVHGLFVCREGGISVISW